MFHPKIIIIPGTDVETVVEKLKIFKNYYTVDTTQTTLQNSKLVVNRFNWSLNGIAELKDLNEGLKLSFFNSDNVKLSWDPMEHIPKNWIEDREKGWALNIDNDVALWNSEDPEVALTSQEKLMLTTILDNCIGWDIELYRFYNKALIPTFKHPTIKQMLINLGIRKHQHVEMWNYFYNKFEFLDYYILPRVMVRKQAITFIDMVKDITELIAAENIIKPAITDCLNYFTKKGHFLKSISLVQRRDKESIEHAQVLKILLDQVEKMYPFLHETIEICDIKGKYYAKMYNENFYKLPNLEIFNQSC